MQLLLLLASVLCAGVPMFGFLAAIWWLDRYDREPVWLLAVTFLWGAVGAIGLSMVVSVMITVALLPVLDVLAVPPATAQALAGPVFVAPLVEEPSKASILLLVLWNRHFDNMTDGFVYGAAAGLGFGMTENLLYFVSVSTDFGTWGSTVLIRTFYSAVMHATATAVVGAALGYARFRGPARLLAAGVSGLVLAIGVHGLWNGMIMMSGLTGGESFFMANLVLFPIEVAAVFLVFQICLLEESATIRRELEDEARAGRIPKSHPRIVASWLKRLSTQWLPAAVDRDAYVQAATSLAMRKKQVRLLGGSRRAPDFYVDEVQRLRERVVQLLGPLRSVRDRRPSPTARDRRAT